MTDGTKIVRKKGGALFKYGDRIGGADVIFGEAGDSLLLGAFTLEALGLSLDPLRRAIKAIAHDSGGLSINFRAVRFINVEDRARVWSFGVFASLKRKVGGFSIMKSYRIAVIAGDGIGQEVIPVGIQVLDSLAERFEFGFEWRHFPWGSDHYFQNGSMMPRAGLEQLRSFDAIYLGAVGHPKIQDNVTLNGLLLPIRRGFDQYACVRPSVLYPGARSPLAGKRAGDIDLVVVRENTEGEYSQVGGNVYPGSAHEVAIQTGVFTRMGTERIIRFSFELARRRNKKRRLASVTKSNAQGFSMAFWDRVFDEVSRDFPDIQTESLLVDAACMDLIRRPESFDVIVASNLFGDILTDMSAMITGSLGLAPSANLNPSRAYPSMFEPVHGSAPDIAGKGIANPMATILAGAMMLEFLGELKASRLLEASVVEILSNGKPLTPDLGGSARTVEVGAAITECFQTGRLERMGTREE